MGKSRFTPRALKFLELYFSGFLIMDAARAAGFKASSPQSLCNTGTKILRKFYRNPKAIFGRGRGRQRKIAKMLAEMAENGQSERQQLRTLKTLSKYMGG